MKSFFQTFFLILKNFKNHQSNSHANILIRMTKTVVKINRATNMQRNSVLHSCLLLPLDMLTNNLHQSILVFDFFVCLFVFALFCFQYSERRSLGFCTFSLIIIFTIIHNAK